MKFFVSDLNNYCRDWFEISIYVIYKSAELPPI